MDAGWAREVETIERGVWDDLFAAAPLALKETLGLRTHRFGAAIALVAPKIPDTQFNRVFGFGADADASEAELDDAIAAMRASGALRWWLQSNDARLLRWANARGFRRWPRPWAKMARGPAKPADVLTSYRIEEIGCEAGGAFAALVCEGFGAPPLIAPWFKALVGRTGWRLYVARDGKDAVAAAALRIEGDTAWLGIAATAASARRRGAQGALMARRIEDAISARCRIIVTETGAKQPGIPNPSYDNMLRHGFMVVHERANLVPPEMA